MSRTLSNIGLVAASTVGSRVLGLVRDALLFALLGASGPASAFIVAFTLPNLFRRLLGEGALSSAFVPVLSGIAENEGDKPAHRFVNQLLTRALVTLIGLSLALVALLGILRATLADLPPRWSLGFELGIAMMPYLAFICLAALVNAALNVFRRFALAALAPILLNVALILALGTGWFLGALPEEIAWLLALGVLAGGCAQLLVPAAGLRRQGWRPRWDLAPSDALSRVWRLFLPAVAAAGIVQINLAASRVLAFTLDASAVSLLYLANRLVELPLGIFAIAITTVLFPELARLASRGDHAALGRETERGIRLIFAITFPAAIGLILLRESIVETLFGWRAFGADDVTATARVLYILALGLPFFALAGFLTRVFHALEDMTTPMRLSAIHLFVNLTAGVLLMVTLGVEGLALASVLAAGLHFVLLHMGLQKKLLTFATASTRRSAYQIATATFTMAFVILLCLELVPALAGAGKRAALLQVVTLIPLAVGIYGGMLALLRFEEMRALSALLRRTRDRLRGPRSAAD